MKGGFPYHIYAFWENLDASALGQGVICVLPVNSVFFKGKDLLAKRGCGKSVRSPSPGPCAGDLTYSHAIRLKGFL